MSRKTLPRQFERPVVSKLRELCLSLPETSEHASWGHPNFRVGKRTFVTFEVFKDKPSIAFRLDRATVDMLLRRTHFFVTPYGRGQWVSLDVTGNVNWRLVGQLVRRSYHQAVRPSA